MKGEKEQWLSEVRGKSEIESCYWLRVEKIGMKAVMCLSGVVIVDENNRNDILRGSQRARTETKGRVNHVLRNTVNTIKLVDYQVTGDIWE